MLCTNCGREIPDGDEYCQFCGYIVNEDDEKTVEQKHQENKHVAIITLLVFVIVIALAVIVNQNNERKRQESINKALMETAEDMKNAYEDFQEDAEQITTEIDERRQELQKGE